MTMLMRLMVLMMRKDDHFSDNGCNDNDDHDQDADLMMIDGCCGGRRVSQQYPHLQLQCSDLNLGLGISGSTSARPPATSSADILRTWQTRHKQGVGCIGCLIQGLNK